MILVFPFLWLLLWASISVLVCAFMGLSPATALRTGGIIFLLGGFGLPLIGWLTLRVTRRSHTKR